MFKYFRYAKKFIIYPLTYFYEGYRHRLFLPYFKAFMFYLKRSFGNFYRDLHLSKSKHKEFAGLQKRVKGLHALFGKDSKFSYSILVPLENGPHNGLKETLISCCDQTSLDFEILVGCRSSLSKSSQKIVQKFEEAQKITFYDFTQEDNNAPLLNLLAEKAVKKYLLIVGENDLIRPDLLFRYEQLLRSFKDPETIVVSSHENVINDLGIALPNSEKEKKIPVFPYFFQEAFSLEGLLIPANLWKKTSGLRYEFKGAESEDLLLRLDIEGAAFSNIPIALYSCRAGNKDKIPSFSKFQLKKAMEEYTLKKGLNWKFTLGNQPSSIQAIPEPDLTHKVQVIVPYKDLKEMTLRSIELVLKQKDVALTVTAIDNNSKDLKIAEAIRQMGSEVLTIDEPFNYSRLNNLAVERSESGKSCDLLLFLNNDVELENDALLEMLRWIDQPKIGAVGARLLYPDGKIQHGGIDFEPYKYEEIIHYNLVDYMQEIKSCNRSLELSVVDSVTGACFLIKKDLFLRLGGFNEIWFPVAYSDVELTERLENFGLKCFYTPYAVGVHHESISRKFVLEDVENSRWLHDLVKAQRQAGRSLRIKNYF